MGLIWEIAWFLIAHWYAVLWAGAVVAGYVVGGWRLALLIASFGVAATFYQKGWNARETKVDDDADTLEQHYRDIEADNRPNIDRDINRLRDL